jgi:hypothetical protein
VSILKITKGTTNKMQFMIVPKMPKEKSSIKPISIMKYFSNEVARSTSNPKKW